MAIYQIVEMGDTVLKEKAIEVTKFGDNLHRLLDDMAETMYQANGVGLAAPQVGISKRVVVIDVGDGIVELINPRLVETEGEETEVEGCLSVPGVWGDVTRAAKVKVTGLNRHGEEVNYEASGLFARALQHEIDHLEGILFVEKANKIERKK